MSIPDSPRFTPRVLVLVAGLVALASTGSCRCIEHPLYDARTNRFDSWYLGGGNTQYRPFRSVQYDPDAAFELELRHRHEGEQVVVAARLHGQAPADLEGELVASWAVGTLADEPLAHETSLATFEHVDDDLALATIDRERLVELDHHGATLMIRFTDEVDASARMDLWPADILYPPLIDSLSSRQEPSP